MVKVLPGGFYVTGDPQDMVVTILGSCVAACMRDPATGFGGLNHFMLPDQTDGSRTDLSALRYGTFAMERLINEVTRWGCPKERLEIKVFGGGQVTTGTNTVGLRNAAFVLEYLRAEGLKVAGEDLGGLHARRIHYCPVEGRVMRRLIKSGAAHEHVEEEGRYTSRLAREPLAGDVELFS